MSSLTQVGNQIETTWRQLSQRWQDTKTVWNDPVRWDFEKEYWAPLEQQVAATERAMKWLAQVIAKARQSVK